MSTDTKTDAMVFDLDGTLVDSAPDIQAAANRMLEGAGYDPLDLPTAIGFIGHGIPNLVRLAMAHRGVPAEREAEMTAHMLAEYTAHPADLTRPYPGVVECLQALKADGLRLGVCTNKLHAPSVQILEALGLSGYFDVVIGGDTLPVKKPDPAPLFAAFEALGGRPALYVGDSEVDAETAQRAGLRFALFTRGYRKTPVDELPHDLAFDSYTCFTHLLREWTVPG